MNAVKVQILWEGPKFFKKSPISFWNASTYLVVTSTQSGRFWKKIMAFSEYLNFNHNDPFGFLRHAKGTEKDFDSICLHAPKDTWVVNTGGRILQQNCAVVQAKHNDRSLTHSWDPNHPKYLVILFLAKFLFWFFCETPLFFWGVVLYWNHATFPNLFKIFWRSPTFDQAKKIK